MVTLYFNYWCPCSLPFFGFALVDAAAATLTGVASIHTDMSFILRKAGDWPLKALTERIGKADEKQRKEN